MKIFFLDTETTGTDPKSNAIWQIAGAVRTTAGDKFFNSKCQPHKGAVVNQKALEVGNISEDILFSFPLPETTVSNLTKLLDIHCDKYNPKDKFILCGYNATFDKDFLFSFFKQNAPPKTFFGSYFYYYVVDLYAFFQSLYLTSLLKGIENLKLATVHEWFFGEKFEGAHDALADIKATIRIYDEIYKPFMTRGYKVLLDKLNK